MGEAQRHDPLDGAATFPRVPGYAWAWLQRSRPVLLEVAVRLTGGPPTPGLTESLRSRFDADSFTRTVVIGAVADVAFGGRVPQRRPGGASWDRGLTWWAAAIAGVAPEEFDARPVATQRRLFAPEDDAEQAPPPPRARARRTSRPDDRAVVVSGLRELLASAEGDSVPVAAVRQLLASLEQR